MDGTADHETECMQPFALRQRHISQKSVIAKRLYKTSVGSAVGILSDIVICHITFNHQAEVTPATDEQTQTDIPYYEFHSPEPLEQFPMLTNCRTDT